MSSPSCERFSTGRFVRTAIGLPLAASVFTAFLASGENHDTVAAIPLRSEPAHAATGPVKPPAGCGRSMWVAAWSAAPSDAVNGQPGLPITGPETAAMTDQTLRQPVVLNGSGRRVRLTLSNVLGRTPVRLGRVTVGIADGDATVDEDTVRHIVFHSTDASGVTIVPAGSELVSRGVRLRVPFRSRVMVDMHVISALGATEHNLGLETSFLSSAGTGDLTGMAEIRGPGSATTQHRVLLAAVDVRTPSYDGGLVAVGDSITDGDGMDARIDADERYPDHLARRLHRHHPDLAVSNAGIAANQVLSDATVTFWGGPALLTRFERDVLNRAGVSGVLLLAGINDLGLSSRTAADVIPALREIARAAHAAGVPVTVSTLLPMKGASYDSDAVQVERSAVNAWIREQEVFDRVVDLDALLRDPADPLALLPRFDSGDHLHPSPAGYAAMGSAVAAVRPPGIC